MPRVHARLEQDALVGIAGRVRLSQSEEAPSEPVSIDSPFLPIHAGSAFVVPTAVEESAFPAVRAAALWLVPEMRSYPQPAEAMIVYALRAGRREPRTIRRPRDPRIRAALDAMNARYAEPLTVDDLARAAAMSRFHFSRLFRDEVGEAPYQHLLRVRVARAAELLQNGRTSVTEAALAVGFHDFSRFSRTFRRFIGRLPVEVARGSRMNAARRAAARSGSSAAPPTKPL
jgi:AraC-like DNA-binding protein